ncbi:TetR/AcrR family transcriptional regulator [Cellulosimicrobium composti]|uniref:TetR/AcrR family transcriptional regulator n=1 Tax=Cellulosimicrobium composti TaxID=2672572 RepID=UPI00298E4582|nr:helix-turn-helix domain-containing protein [Cellulosimicrobium composti]
MPLAPDPATTDASSEAITASSGAPAGVDRRAALRARHHRAIVDAAAALMAEKGGSRFTVDELAARADVARRTVFNHFASLDDVVVEVCEDVLGAVVDALGASAAAPGTDRATPLDDLTAALRGTDLVGPMASLTRALGGGANEPTPRVTTMVVRAFTHLAERLVAETTRRHPHVDPLEIELLVGALMAGLMVIQRRWWAATGAADDEASRRVWAALLDRLVERTRAGWATRA